MALQNPVYPASFAVAALLVVAAAVQTWQLRDEPGGRPLLVTLVGLAFWACCELAVATIPGTALAITFMKLWYVGISVVVAGLLAFALDFTGHEQYLTRRTVGALTVWPILFTIVIWLRTDLVYASLTPDPTVGSGWATTYGIGFGLNAVYSYLLLAAATVLLVRFALTSKFLYRRQIAVLLVGILTPWLSDLLFITRSLPFDLTALGFAVTGLSFTWALRKTQFLDVTPVARDRVVETLASAMFVLDSENRLVDCNQWGFELLEITPEDIGQPMESVLDSLSGAVAEFAAAADITDEQTFQTKIADNHYEIEITPLEDDRGYLVGRVFLVHDITEQKQRQARLEQQNDRLDQFAGVVSHDLRNPVNIASGYVELARTTGEEAYFDRIEESHRRMEQLIDELLAFARLDDADIETTSVDITSCATTAWQQVETEAAELEVDCDTRVDGNREYLLHLFENLYRNSVEHGSDDQWQPGAERDGSPLTVTVAVEDAAPTDSQSDEGAIRLTVSDDGPGIPPEERDAVLEEGYSTGSDGIGLGLAIVSEIAAAHEWSISVQESAAGGAAFVFDGVELGQSAAA